MARKKHPNRDLEKILKRVEEEGWEVSFNQGSQYWRIRCGCGQHQRSVHKTPSNPYYCLDLRKWIERQSCWKRETR